MGFFSRVLATTKADFRQLIAEEKCKMLDAKARGDKSAVLNHQKEIEKLKVLMANAPTKQYR